MKKKFKRLLKLLQRTHKQIKSFVDKTTKNYNLMKKNINAIWATVCVCLAIVSIHLTSCNVTRTITNESKYYQKNDTSVVITTKTVESYNAEKNK